MNAKSDQLFFELLRIAVGSGKELSATYSDAQWAAVFDMARAQCVEGVLWPAVETLPREQYPPQALLLQWYGAARQIEHHSAAMKKAGEEAVQFFHEQGFACQLLKGDAVARYYPQPLGRTSGDVDIWLAGGRKKIYDFARKFDKDGKLYGVNYHHIHFHLIENVPLEVHIWPSYFHNPILDCRLHRFCKLHEPTLESDMPSLAFDRVFILLHCFRHICGHGVGLRQVMDYYYVLKQGFTPKEREDSVYWIKKLGMSRFARGVMWVLQRCFGLEEQCLLMPADEKEGRFVLREIMLTGNMGHSDKRRWGSMQTPVSRFLLNLRRDAYIARHYPSEALWQPFFSLWLYVWRVSKGLYER